MVNPHADSHIENTDFPEAAIAGTLALMTCHVQCVEDLGRDELARLVVSNLAKLSCHPQLSNNFKSMLLGLHMRWQIQLQNQMERSRFAPPPHDDTRAWVAAPSCVQ